MTLTLNEHINEEIIKYINETYIISDINIFYQIILSTFTFETKPTSQKYKEKVLWLYKLSKTDYNKKINVNAENYGALRCSCENLIKKRFYCYVHKIQNINSPIMKIIKLWRCRFKRQIHWYGGKLTC